MRKQLQIAHVKDASLGAKLVKLADKLANLSDLLENPPASWPEQEIAGYAVWCLAVYRQLRGVSAYFDAQFLQLFQRFGFWEHSDADVEIKLVSYYKNISCSE